MGQTSPMPISGAYHSSQQADTSMASTTLLSYANTKVQALRTSKTTGLDHGSFGSIRSRSPGTGNTARASSNDQKVVSCLNVARHDLVHDMKLQRGMEIK